MATKKYKYQRECQICHKQFGTNVHNKYVCSDECKKRKEVIRKQKKANIVPLKERKYECVVCHEKFIPKQWNQMTCDKPECVATLAHQQAIKKKEKYKQTQEKEETRCIICNEPFVKRNKQHVVCDKLECKLEQKKRKRILREEKRKQILVLTNSEPTMESVDEWLDYEKEKIDQQIGQKLLEQKLMEMKKAKYILDGILEAMIPIEPEIRKEISLANKKIKRSYSTDPEVAVLALGDFHIGKKTSTYNTEVFKRRIRGIILAIRKLYLNVLQNAYTIPELTVVVLGDVVDGNSIYKTQPWHIDEHTMYQIWRTGLPELSWAFIELSALFEKVNVVWISGNHGRVGNWDPEELNFDTMLGEALKLALSKFDNIKFDVVWDWYSLIEINKRKFLATHGGDIKMHYQIPWYGILQKAMRWRGSIGDFEYLMLGHFHILQWFQWNDMEIIGNGTLLTDDDFSLRALGMGSIPKQYFFGMHPRKGATWVYKLNVIECEKLAK